MVNNPAIKNAPLIGKKILPIKPIFEAVAQI
jgi:hypothetical protein